MRFVLAAAAAAVELLAAIQVCSIRCNMYGKAVPAAGDARAAKLRRSLRKMKCIAKEDVCVGEKLGCM